MYSQMITNEVGEPLGIEYYHDDEDPFYDNRDNDLFDPSDEDEDDEDEDPDIDDDSYDEYRDEEMWHHPIDFED